MDSPVAAIKSAFNLKLIITTTVVVLIIFGIAEKAGWTSWLLAPFSSFKNRKTE